MQKSLLATIMLLSASALAVNNNAVDMAQPNPPSKVKTTSVVTTERTVSQNGSSTTTSDVAVPVEEVQEAQPTDKLPAPKKYDDSNVAQTIQQLTRSLKTLQKSTSLEEMHEPLHRLSIYADQAQVLGLGKNVSNTEQQAYTDELAQFRQGIVSLKSKVDSGDFAGAKAQVEVLEGLRKNGHKMLR